MSYRPRPSPLHAASAAVAVLWCAALLTAALVSANPLWLLTLVLVVCVAGVLAGVSRQILGCLRFAIPLAVVICLINAVVTRDGLTVIWRFGDLPILGQTDVTLQASVYGAVLGLRAVVIVLVAALYSVAVDPDDLLRLFRRFSFRSALSAAVATRMVPVLISDSRRLADAQRCRPGAPAGRVQLLHATTVGVVDRALDVAATLEVRGYALARQNRPAPRPRWRRRLGVGSGSCSGSGSGPGQAPILSLRFRLRLGQKYASATRQNLGFLASALAVLATALLGRLLNATSFNAYPGLELPGAAMTVVAGIVLAVASLSPFLDRRGVRT